MTCSAATTVDICHVYR